MQVGERKTMTLRPPTWLRLQLETHAEDQGLSLNEVLVDILMSYFQESDEEQPANEDSTADNDDLHEALAALRRDLIAVHGNLCRIGESLIVASGTLTPDEARAWVEEVLEPGGPCSP